MNKGEKYTQEVEIGLSFNEYIKEAVEYWSQDQNSNAATKEILFVGDVEVIEILKTISRPISTTLGSHKNTLQSQKIA